MRGLSLVAASGGPLFIAVRGPLTIVASRCGAQAPDAQAQQLWLTGLVAPQHVGSSQTRARTRVPCISRQTLNHCATRETPFWLLTLVNLLCLGSPFCRLQVRSSRFFWCLSPVAKVVSVGFVGFLMERASACAVVDEAGSCLSGGQVHFWWCVLRCLWPYSDFRQPLC